MKKIFVFAVALMCTAITVSAQDMAEATETAKAANEALTNGDNKTALELFQNALENAMMCGDEGMELAETCKGIIPKIMLSMGKSEIKAKNYDGAIAILTEAVAAAKQYGARKVADECAEYIDQVYTQRAGELLNNKDFAGAAEAYRAILEKNPKDGMASLRLGMALAQLGNTDEAVEAYENAMANGQDKAAGKQLSTIFVKNANAALKAQKYQEAIDAAVKSNEYLENANAYKIAASAAQKLKKDADTIGYYEKYLELSPNASDANGIICTIAVLYQQLGNKEKAIENYSKILTDPKFGETAKAQLAALKK